MTENWSDAIALPVLRRRQGGGRPTARPAALPLLYPPPYDGGGGHDPCHTAPIGLSFMPLRRCLYGISTGSVMCAPGDCTTRMVSAIGWRSGAESTAGVRPRNRPRCR